MRDEICAILKGYMKKYGGISPNIHNLPNSLQIRTITAVQSTPRGKKKLYYNLETVLLQVRSRGQKPMLIARLSEELNNKLDWELNEENFIKHTAALEHNLVTLKELVE